MILPKLMFKVYDFFYDFFVARVTFAKNLVNVALFSLWKMLMFIILLRQLNVSRCTILFLISKLVLGCLLHNRLNRIFHFIIFSFLCCVVIFDSLIILNAGQNICLPICQILAFCSFALLPDKFFDHIQPIIYR